MWILKKDYCLENVKACLDDKNCKITSDREGDLFNSLKID
jgi:hypothetical protein